MPDHVLQTDNLPVLSWARRTGWIAVQFVQSVPSPVERSLESALATRDTSGQTAAGTKSLVLNCRVCGHKMLKVQTLPIIFIRIKQCLFQGDLLTWASWLECPFCVHTVLCRTSVRAWQSAACQPMVQKGVVLSGWGMLTVVWGGAGLAWGRNLISCDTFFFFFFKV